MKHGKLRHHEDERRDKLAYLTGKHWIRVVCPRGRFNDRRIARRR